ncbi:signal peptidase II [Allosaccharopolyspora coralli]|uniref:Lipoprotein signal peptidase n=1 Tax=Allosaccharopolyspora coralli TaxID=2665642 RepID=A0A5Q3Q6P1_9PSEU|nr:signal peptidase II [Allosaccharopolyspora coralli]QGK70278.1 signal peptidase II [Allosaccharopolyspora coralli]
MTRTAAPVVSAARRRATLATTAALLALGDLAVKTWAVQALAAGHSLDLGLLQLRLAYNPGVAFSLGATLPGWVVLTATALITTGIAVYAWRSARTANLALRTGMAAVLAGAVANLIDRGIDGVVTDYLHTGWWPTFNLADVLITCGGALIVLATLRSPDHRREPAED